MFTKLPGVPDSSEVKPGMASFANTGPFGTTCASCRFRGYWVTKVKRDKVTGRTGDKRVRSMGCKKYLELAMRHGPPVDGAWPSCKYYENKWQK